MTIIDQIRALALQGVGRKNAEATIGRAFSEEELNAFRKAQTVRQLQIAAKKAKGPASSADRVAKHVSERNDVGEIPPVANPERREACRNDLELFGWTYCRPLLKHRASEDIKDGLIQAAQECILNGGQIVDLYGRGGGKTTWIEQIASLWAILYGHRRFPVVIGASLKSAKKCLKTIRKLIARSPEILADFPAIAIPVRHLGGVAQRAASQTYHGQPTDVEWGTDQITLPMLRDADGNPLEEGCGAILAVTGVGGAIRGANEGGQRPDMLLGDDLQTKKAAASPKLVQGIIEYIHSDALALAGHDTTMAAFITITPQRFGDVASELSNQAKYPEWTVKVQPFIKTLPPNWEQLCALFCEQYAADAANKDFTRSRSTAWYRENMALFEKMETIDSEQYDHLREVDVNHHLLNLRAKMGKRAFDAEIMMTVVDGASEIDINSDKVAESLNGAPRGTLPRGTDTVVAACDINIQEGTGLSWVLLACGPQRTTAVIDYGRYPADGSPLVPKNAPDTLKNRRVAAGIRAVVNLLATKRIRDSKNRAVRIRALAFDRGWKPDVVHRTLYVIRKTVAVGFPILAMRGFPWNKFGTRKNDILRRGDHIFATRSKFGEYLAFMSPYWTEIMQSSFLETALMPGSCSLFGSDAAVHFHFANEVTADKLVRKYEVYSGKDTTIAWDYPTLGANHYGDALKGAYALASWFRAYDALSSIIDAAALGVREAHQDDLFDPMKNSALLKYNAATDTTEGTGDTGTLPHPSEADLEADLEDGRESPVYPEPKFKRVIPAQRGKMPRLPVRRFKKGKWKK